MNEDDDEDGDIFLGCQISILILIFLVCVIGFILSLI